MLSRARALLRWRSGHGVLLTFVVTILVPGIVIAFIGFWLTAGGSPSAHLRNVTVLSHWVAESDS